MKFTSATCRMNLEYVSIRSLAPFASHLIEMLKFLSDKSQNQTSFIILTHLMIFGILSPASTAHNAFSLRIFWILSTKSFTSPASSVPSTTSLTAWMMHSVFPNGLKVDKLADTAWWRNTFHELISPREFALVSRQKKNYLIHLLQPQEELTQKLRKRISFWLILCNRRNETDIISKILHDIYTIQGSWLLLYFRF